MRRRRTCRAAWQHKGFQRGHLPIHRRQFRFQPRRLRIRHTQPRPRFTGHAKISADIEQIILDARQHRISFRVFVRMQAQHPYRGIGLIHRAIGFNTQSILAYPRPITERGFAAIPAARHNHIKLDHHSIPVKASHRLSAARFQGGNAPPW